MSEQFTKKTEPTTKGQKPQPVSAEDEEVGKAQLAIAQRNYDYHHKRLGFMVRYVFWPW